MLLRSAIAAGVEYVDIEADIILIRRQQHQADHQFPRHVGDSQNLEDLHAAMADEDADIVKIATMANSFADNLRMVICSARSTNIGICIGKLV